jgi:hypothetical protein
MNTNYKKKDSTKCLKATDNKNWWSSVDTECSSLEGNNYISGKFDFIGIENQMFANGYSNAWTLREHYRSQNQVDFANLYASTPTQWYPTKAPPLIIEISKFLSVNTRTPLSSTSIDAKTAIAKIIKNKKESNFILRNG